VVRIHSPRRILSISYRRLAQKQPTISSPTSRCLAGLLRHAGLSEGAVCNWPLVLLAAGILLKPRTARFIESLRKDRTD